MKIRQANAADFEALRAIYNYEVENGCNNFDTHAIDAEEWTHHMGEYNHPGDNHPLLVAVDDDNTACGYASLSPFRAKHGYAGTVELSIYVSPNKRGHGLGNLLMEAILDAARGSKTTHAVISVITEDNKASAAMHSKFGFTYQGSLHDVAYKLGEYRDISYYQLLV
jgi:L-amino acid N-acyltransferase